MWSTLGKVLVVALPHVINLVENLGKGKTSSEKADIALTAAIESVKDIETATGKKILARQDVRDALKKANDALVNVQNVVAKAMQE